jgi:tetratricopeptide (TPR) repeat protein
VVFHASDELLYEERIERAWSFALVGRFGQAENEFETTHQLFGEQPDLYEHLARFYFAKRDYLKARTFIEQALDSNSDQVDLLELKAFICMETKNWQEAELCFRRVIALDPKRKQAYLHLADMYEIRGKDRQRETMFVDAIEACDFDPDIVSRFVDVLFAKRKFSHIKALVTKCLEQYPGHPNLLLRMSQVYAANRERRRALESLFEAIQSQPDTFSFWRDAGEIYYQFGDYNQAYDAYNNALLYDEGDGVFYGKMADMSFNLRRYDDAWRLAERAEELGGEVVLIKEKIKKNRFSV